MTPTKIRCTATTRKGTPCQAWAVPGSDPPTCASHRLTGPRPGPPRGNANAITHGAYRDEKPAAVDLQARIADLDRRIERLSRYIDQAEVGDGEGGTITVGDYTRLVSLHGQLTSRIGRLLRDQQQLGGGDISEMQAAIDQALTQAGQVLGIEL